MHVPAFGIACSPDPHRARPPLIVEPIVMNSLQQRIRNVAMIVVVMGAAALATPRVAAAGDGDVCCKVGSGPRCCGGACEATATACEACTTYLGCLLF